MTYYTIVCTLKKLSNILCNNLKSIFGVFFPTKYYFKYSKIKIFLAIFLALARHFVWITSGLHWTFSFPKSKCQVNIQRSTKSYLQDISGWPLMICGRGREEKSEMIFPLQMPFWIFPGGRPSKFFSRRRASDFLHTPILNEHRIEIFSWLLI